MFCSPVKPKPSAAFCSGGLGSLLCYSEAMANQHKILGIDPGLACTGWGVVTAVGNSLSFVACGVIKTNAKTPDAERLKTLADGLDALIAEHAPTSVGVEEVFVNSNAKTSLKLGQARGVGLVCAARAGLEVGEYTPLKVKQAVVGYGKADKTQVTHMIQVLLPTAKLDGLPADASDALAVAITHAHHAGKTF